MRPRAELALGAVLVLALAVAAGLLGLGRARLTDADPRRSTFLAGPAGARGFAEALARLGVRVERLPPAARQRSTASPATAPLVAFLGPSESLDPREGAVVAGAPGRSPARRARRGSGVPLPGLGCPAALP